MSKKVLIITYYWPPMGGSGVQRWVKFVKYLREFGYEPIVYTASNNAVGLEDKSLLADIPKGIAIYSQPFSDPINWFSFFKKNKQGNVSPNFLSGNNQYSFKEKLMVGIRGNFFIPDAKMFWIRKSANFLLREVNNGKLDFDAIISSGPPHSCHLIASKLHAKLNKPWIADFRDPWTQIEFFGALRLTLLARRIHEKLERKVLNTATCNLVVGKMMKQDFSTLTKNRIEVITNGYDNDDGLVIDLDTQFTISYLGTMNSSRNPEVLWEAIQHFIKIDHPLLGDLKVQLIGYIEDSVFSSIQEHGVSQFVEHTSYMPYLDAQKVQAASQVLLVVINQTVNNRAILTGKIFECISSGRPTICIGPIDGDAADVITASKAGIVIDYKDTQTLISSLEDYYALYKKSNLKCKIGPEVSRYSRRNLTQDLARILDEIT